MAVLRERRIRTQAADGFFLHCLMAMHMQAIAGKALGSEGFSLTRHRILGFATLTPGITIGELVQALRVSRQALHRPLGALISEGYVEEKNDPEDRRQKQLYPTRKGSRLYLRVIAKNIERVEQVFQAAGPQSVRGFLDVHRRLIDARDCQWIEVALKVVEANEGKK
jgi:DNA-binding MarR family transcriptional regulator